METFEYALTMVSLNIRKYVEELYKNYSIHGMVLILTLPETRIEGIICEWKCIQQNQCFSQAGGKGPVTVGGIDLGSRI